MSALVAGYDSSDDEQPQASSSTLPKLGNGSLKPAADGEDEDEDETQLEEQARTDAFGLASQPSKKTNGVAKRTEVAAAPDVLREVCELCLMGFSG